MAASDIKCYSCIYWHYVQADTGDRDYPECNGCDDFWPDGTPRYRNYVSRCRHCKWSSVDFDDGAPCVECEKDNYRKFEPEDIEGSL